MIPGPLSLEGPFRLPTSVRRIVAQSHLSTKRSGPSAATQSGRRQFSQRQINLRPQVHARIRHHPLHHLSSPSSLTRAQKENEKGQKMHCSRLAALEQPRCGRDTRLPGISRWRAGRLSLPSFGRTLSSMSSPTSPTSGKGGFHNARSVQKDVVRHVISDLTHIRQGRVFRSAPIVIFQRMVLGVWRRGKDGIGYSIVPERLRRDLRPHNRRLW